MEDQNEAVLNIQQRRKKAAQLRRRKARIQRQKALVMRRFADKGRITKRAKRGARNVFKKRFAGGKSYSSLSTAQKITVDKRTEKMRKAISRVAARLVPQFRRKEMARKSGRKEDLDLEFDTLFLENWDEPETDGLKMAEAQLYDLAEDALAILDLISVMEEEPDEWVLSKITLASDYMSTVRDFLEYYDDEEDEEDDEEDDEEYSESTIIEAMLDLGKEELEDLDGFYEEYSNLRNKAIRHEVPFDIVLEVYNRGLESYKEERFKTPQQVAFSRVNTFLANGDIDADLQEKVLEYGTDDSRIYYARATPGQNPDIVTMKYSVDSVMNALNDVNTQRIKKIHERADDEFAEVFGDKK